MKPARFGYHRVASVREAVDALSVYEGTARLIAGGQSLVPMLNMRLLRPDALIDVSEIRELGHIRDDGDAIVVGAAVRYSDLEASDVIRKRAPLVARVLPHIGDRQIRNRGTIGGSLAHGDPTSEMALACLVMGAKVQVSGPGGTRTEAVEHLFLDSYTTNLDPLEMLTSIEIPVHTGQTSFIEFCRRHNDFAVLSVACLGTRDDDGRWSEVRIGLGGMAETPRLAARASRALAGTRLHDDEINAAAELALEAVDPGSDIRASADYRRHLASAYVRRALSELREDGDSSMSGAAVADNERTPDED